MSLYQVLFSTEVHSQKWDILLIIEVKVQEKNWNLKLGKWGKAFINGAVARESKFSYLWECRSSFQDTNSELGDEVCHLFFFECKCALRVYQIQTNLTCFPSGHSRTSGDVLAVKVFCVNMSWACLTRITGWCQVVDRNGPEKSRSGCCIRLEFLRCSCFQHLNMYIYSGLNKHLSAVFVFLVCDFFEACHL